MSRGDLSDARIIWFKGGLMLVAGCLSAGMLLAEFTHWRSVALLLIAIWGFCRAYYFAFYVIEHYVDPEYQFSGLIDFVRYLVGKPRARKR